MNQKTQYMLYVVFAVISTLINIGIQKGMEIVFCNYVVWGIYQQTILNTSSITIGLCIQIFTATMLSFVFKYLVDKFLIFKDKTENFSGAHFLQIFLYTLFAVFTTLVFWTTELGFKFLFHFANSEYVGAVIGLGIGYTAKYLLDRKFVFINAQTAES